MFWLAFAAVAAATVWWAASYQPRLLDAGRPLFARTLSLNGRRFYAEENRFPDWHQALHHYMILVPQMGRFGQVREVSFDYMDFSHSVFRFDGFTLYLVRRVDKIRLIKSFEPVPVAEFEGLLPSLNRLLPD